MFLSQPVGWAEFYEAQHLPRRITPFGETHGENHAYDYALLRKTEEDTHPEGRLHQVTSCPGTIIPE